ncbi:MAG: hypothetical protein RIS41_1679 [Actinomycetota bacterium]|jgi:hypothetical protein
MSATMNYVPADLPADVQWGFTREGLYALVHHGHPIAHSRGSAQKMMATYWTGLTWQQAMGLVSKTGVFVKRGNSFLGLDVADHVKELHLLIGGEHRVVELAEHEVTPTKPIWAGASVLTAVRPSDVATEGRRRRLALKILGSLGARDRRDGESTGAAT